ncbi:MAG: hypothetical protein AAGA54_03340 [Myxococcota bacterium]
MTPPGDDDLGIGAIKRSGESAPADPAAPVQGPEAAASTEAAAAVDRAAAPGTDPLGLDALTEALASGAISPVEAKAQLIDQVVASQLPADADPAVIEAVRAQVGDLLADDPTIARLLDPHG